MSSLMYNGHDFAELFVYGEPKISILDAQPKTQEISGRDGAAFIGSTFGVSTISFTIVAYGDLNERRNKFSELGNWLAVDEPKPLYTPDSPDRYYLAVPDGNLALNRLYECDTAEITFTLTYPVAYGIEEHSFTVPSAGSVTFTVGGTHPTRPLITASEAVRDGTSLVYGIKLDNAKYVHIATGSGSSRSVAIDCDKRTAKVQGSTAMITLDSDWLELTPGQHTLNMDKGTGAATVTWRDRWY